MARTSRPGRTRLAVAGLALAVAASAAPSVSPAAAADDFILMPRAELLALPTNGAAWDSLVSWAGRSAASPDLSDQDDPDNVVVLAKALVAARTGNTALRDAVVAALRAIPETENGGRTLALARELGAYVLAADLVGYRDAAFVSWLRAVRTESLEGRTLVSTHEDRPNNWGTHAGATRVIVARYLGDTADLARAANVFKGYLGDRAAYAGFSYGELSWQANSSAPVGINPKGATKNGVVVDGIMPDDMRRGGTFPTVGADGVSYTWEGLQGVLLQAEMLTRAGYPAYGWQDAAIGRAVARINALGYPASGDDAFQPWLVNFRYGTTYATATANAGKAFGFTDWLYGGRMAATPTATPAPTPTATPAPTPTATPAPTPTATPAPTPTATPAPTPTATPASTATATPAPTPTAVAAAPLALAPSADAEVKSKYPSRNYGSAATLRIREASGDVHRTYLAFSVPPLDRAVASVALRLYVTDGSRAGGSVHLVTAPFDERTITYVDAPKLGAKIASVGPVAKGRWVEIPLSVPVVGGQVLRLALASTGTDSAIFASRESTSAPALAITLAR